MVTLYFLFTFPKVLWELKYQNLEHDYSVDAAGSSQCYHVQPVLAPWISLPTLCPILVTHSECSTASFSAFVYPDKEKLWSWFDLFRPPYPSLWQSRLVMCSHAITVIHSLFPVPIIRIWLHYPTAIWSRLVLCWQAFNSVTTNRLHHGILMVYYMICSSSKWHSKERKCHSCLFNGPCDAYSIFICSLTLTSWNVK